MEPQEKKCAVVALNVLAVRFSAGLLNVRLVPLRDKRRKSDWLQRESGILALGAMAEGTRFYSPFICVPAEIVPSLFRLYRC